MSDSRFNPISGFIFGLVFLAIGVAITVFVGLPTLRDAKASAEWPTAEGVIQQSKVVRHEDDDSTTYSAHVLYKYKVEDEEFENDTVRFGEYQSSFRSQFEKTVAAYPQGGIVEVHYNPDNPATAVLEPGTSWSSYILLGVGLLFAFVGLCLSAYPLMLLGFAALLGASALGWGRSNRQTASTTSAPPATHVGAKPAHAPPTAGTGDDGFDIQ